MLDCATSASKNPKSLQSQPRACFKTSQDRHQLLSRALVSLDHMVENLLEAKCGSFLSFASLQSWYLSRNRLVGTKVLSAIVSKRELFTMV